MMFFRSDRKMLPMVLNAVSILFSIFICLSFFRIMNDADLEKLITKPVRLKPKFERNVTEYEVVLDSKVALLHVDPMTRDCNASWQIIGIGTERRIPIEPGKNFTLVIEVTAEDGSTKTYQIHVTSLSPSSAMLSSLSITNQTIIPTFSSITYEYKCNIPSYCMQIKILATSPDKTAQLSITNANDENVVDVNIAITKVSVQVTSPDKTNIAEYIVLVHREKFPFPVSIESIACQICQICHGLIHHPLAITSSQNSGNDKIFCCQNCFMLITRTNKNHPFTGEVLQNDSITEDFEKETEISNHQLKCPLGCEESVTYRLLAEHLKEICKNRLTWCSGNDSLVYSSLSSDHVLNTFESCSKCSRKVRQFDKTIHDAQTCNIFPEKPPGVVKHDWEEKLEQRVVGETVGNILESGKKFEHAFKEDLAKGNCEKAISSLISASEVFAFGSVTQPKNHTYHFELGKTMLNMYYFTEIYQAITKEDKNNNDDDDFEFQTESSMIDDIKALTKQKGYNVESTVDQLKALDEEYHFLLDQGHSEKADYIQKLYAYKQKQQLQETSTGKSKKGLLMSTLLNGYLVRARQKFVDASLIDSNNFQYQLYAGRCYLLEGKFKEAFQSLRYSVSLKPTSIEAKFYLALAAFKSNSTSQNQDVYLQFLVDGINLFIYENLHDESLGKEFIADTLSGVFNILFLQGVDQLLKNMAKKTSSLYLPYDVASLYKFVISQSFHAMYKMPIRKSLFYEFQRLAFHENYALNNYLIDCAKEGQKNDETFKKSLNDLLALFVHSCQTFDEDLLNLKKQICLKAVVLQPRSSKSLYHLAEVLFAMYQQPDASKVNLSEVETLYRCSIEMEGKDQNNGDIPPALRETEIWNQEQGIMEKQQDNSLKGSCDKKSPLKSSGEKTPAAKVPAPSRAAVGRGRAKAVNPKANVKSPVKQPVARVPATTKDTAKGRSKIAGSSATSPSTSKTIGPQNKNETKLSNLKPSPSKEVKSKLPVLINPNIPEAYLGLANLLVQEERNEEEAIRLYKHVISTAPQLHDSYIELGNLYMKCKPLEAVEVYCKYPFNTDSLHEDTESYDDAFLHGEIIRVLMKEQRFDDARLLGHMIPLGKIMGFSYLEKYVTQLENLNKNAFLRELYCGINNKSQDDSDVIAFFKFKLWL